MLLLKANAALALSDYSEFIFACPYNLFFSQLKINAVRILCSVVKSTDPVISHQFIHSCIPSIVAKIENLPPISSELELNYCNESFSLLETLVAMAPENSRECFIGYICLWEITVWEYFNSSTDC